MVEFPVSVKKSTRKPHYMSATEQAKIEIAAPSYLRNIVVILSEIGLRYKKELFPMKKEHVDLENGLVHIADSKTANGIGDMPLTQVAIEAFRRQMDETPGSNYLSPQPETGNAETVHDQSPQSLGGNVEESRGAKFRPYELRHTFATRLRAGGVRRSNGDADVETGRCRGLQAVQSGKARNDARGAYQAGPAGAQPLSWNQPEGRRRVEFGRGKLVGPARFELATSFAP